MPTETVEPETALTLEDLPSTVATLEAADPEAASGDATNVFFNFPAEYGAGINHGIGFAGSTLVAVHELYGKTLSYHVGTLTGGLARFGDRVNYVSGMQPAVAVNAAGTVVEVHVTSRTGSWAMHYMVGELDPAARTIDFGNSLPDDAGKVPQVALNDRGVVVMVHETSNITRNDLWYRVGIVNPDKTLTFTDRGRYGPGRTPAIAINNNNEVIVVHCWRAERQSNTLWYHVGRVDEAGKLTLGARQWYQGGGTNPTVALTDDGFVLEAHDSGVNLWSRIGRLNGDRGTIDWLGDRFLYRGDGSMPRLAADGNQAVRINRQARRLGFAASEIVDRTSWMADNLDLIGDKKLMEIAMPASHNAGMGRLGACLGGASSCNTQCHNTRSSASCSSAAASSTSAR